MLEEGLTRRKLLWMLFDHCCCGCRHRGCCKCGSSSCAPLEACRGLDFAIALCDSRRIGERSFRILSTNRALPGSGVKQGTNTVRSREKSCLSAFANVSLSSQVGAILDLDPAPSPSRCHHSDHDQHQTAKTLSLRHWTRDERRHVVGDVDIHI